MNERPSLKELIGTVSELVSPPEVHIRLTEVIESPTSTADSIAEIIMQDPNLTARVLKITNSAFYGSRKIETVSRAITLIGTRDLYNIALAVNAVKVFEKIPAELVNVSIFWRHSLYTAIIARLLAKRCRILHPERLFVAGLLHDIGCLVLYSQFPDESRDALLIAHGDEDILARQEQELIGYDHASVGAELLRLWKLPETLCASVDAHHDLSRAAPDSMESAIILIANALANRTEEGCFSESGAYAAHITPEAWARLGLDESVIDDMAEQVDEQFAETARILLPN
jgi:putative nucleotidyltransferase with HDIG domain